MAVAKVVLVILSMILATNYFYNTVLPEKKHIRFPELTRRDGYNSEEHEVVTEDGYIISIFRIKSKNCGELRRPLLILHGLLQSSDHWLDPGANHSLPYSLSDECHDVWVGNTRGNFYGRRHTTLNPDRDDEFWQFSADEIGYYDIPAMIDFILKITKASKLNYIGFSQGGGSFYMMCSERPEYNDRVEAMVGLATPTTLKLSTGPLQTMFNTVMKYESLFYKVGIYEAFSRYTISYKLINLVCTLTTRGCIALLTSLDEYNPTTLNDHTALAISQHFPDGTSIRTLARYGQAGTIGKYQKYDFGEDENVKRYGSKKPPLYNLKSVVVPVLLMQGVSDRIVHIKDIELLAKNLPNLKELYVVKDPKWNHFDMIYNQNMKQLLFPRIKEYFNQH